MRASTSAPLARALRELAFFLPCAACVLPLWVVRYLPIQDLPQHLAAISVLHHYADPAFAFSEYFTVDLFRTQYLLYYLLADLLASVFGVELGNRVLVSACLLGTPYALRSLLRALGRSEWLALFSLPLAYNVHLVLGFFNFLLGIPLSLFGLALAVKERRAKSLGRQVGLALTLVACFYAHVVPFALLALGVGLVALERSPRATARGLLPLLPAGVAAALWTFGSPAGQATLSAAQGDGAGPKPHFQPMRLAARDLPNWLTDVLHGDDDLRLLRAFLAILAATCTAGLLAGIVRRARGSEGSDALSSSLVLRLWILPLTAAVLYFAAPTSYDWIWPISQRFALLALLFLVVVLPAPPRRLVPLFVAAVLVVTGLQLRLVGRAFAAFERDEVGDFDRAMDAIPRGQRVVGLVFARGSRHVRFSPFIHYVAHYQARKGGAVMFTFADFPQSPFRFRDERRPPRVPPRWEWTPERVRPSELGFYDYVLTRGGPGVIARASSTHEPVYRGRHWSVFRKLPAAAQVR